MDKHLDAKFAKVESKTCDIESAKGINVTRQEPRETIHTEFDASVARLGPLLKRIEFTDRLIDQIAYKLYGLSEEEIRLVEGRG